jgi:hypothetical protein
MTDQDRDLSEGIPTAPDQDDPIKGFQRLVSRKESERQAAIARAEAAEAELEELRTRVPPEPEPYIDPNRARPYRPPAPPPTSQGYLDSLEGLTWGDLGKPEWDK